ncbi:MAG: metallophosphoesterase family protein [Candidatus Hodarchaeales archaeon]
MQKRYLLVILLLFTLLASPFGSYKLDSVKGAAGTCTWSPSEAEPGTTITITYDASGGPLAGTSDVELVWYMDVFPNKFGVPPSQDMWPENSTLLAPIAPRDVVSPMINTGTDQWQIEIPLNRVFDTLVVSFRSGTTYDRNDNNYWRIDSAIKDERIEPFSPSFISPLFAIPGNTVHFYVNASTSATSWQVQITDKLESPLNLNPTASYDDNLKLWDLTVTIPDNLQYTLYDLKYSATINGHSRYREEPNSLSIIENFKTNYTFVIFSDPQHFRDGSYSEDRNLQSGEGNVSLIAQEIDLINPDFVLLLGDLVEWTDEIAYANAKKWYTKYLDVPMFIIPGNHDGFLGTGSNYEYGSGIGVYQRYFGQRHFKFSYGTHYFVGGYSADREMNPDTITNPRAKRIAQIEWDFIQDSLNNAPEGTTTKFFMMHHPLSPNYATSDESVDLRDDILNLLSTNNFNYYLHGHMHQDKYDVYNGITHIGTNNAVGVPSGEFDNYVGFRIVEMNGNNMTRFSYGPIDAANYYAASNPPHMINVTFDHLNDGSVSNNTAYLYNGYNHSITSAKVRFALSLPPTGKTYESNGSDIAKYVQNSVFYLDSLVDIDAQTNVTIIIKEVDAPITTTTTTTETPASTTTTTTPTTTSEVPTEPTGSPGLEVFLVLVTFVALISFRKRKRI